MLLAPAQRAERKVSKDDNTDRYGRISNVECWPETEINEIGNTAEAQPVNQVAYCATKNQAKG